MSGDLPETLPIFEGDIPYNREMSEIAGRYNGLPLGSEERERLFSGWKQFDLAQYEELFD